MKKLLILAVAALIGGTAAAQQKWGLKAGVNFPKYSFGEDDADNAETDKTTNFHVTGYLDAPLSTNFSIQPGISLQGKGGKYRINANSELEQNTMWIEVPVNLVGKIPVGGATHIFLGAGPYAGFAIAGQNKLEVGNTETETDMDFGNDAGDDLKGIDFGLNALGGIQMSSGLNIGAGYGFGLTDLRPSGSGGNGQQTNRVLSFSVGFSF
jgi:hypothetical protein